MTSIAVQGAAGKLGSKIVEHIERSEQFTFAGTITRELVIPECDVVVSVAGAEGTAELLPSLDTQKLLIGSTGLLPIEEIEGYAKNTSILVAPNFSVGMRLVYKLLNNLSAEELKSFKAIIEDVHHVHKKDSPSGTALKMKKLLSTNGISAEIQSDRAAEVFGSHFLILENEYERITLGHEVLSRDVYAEGCLELISELLSLESGVHFR